MPIIAKRGGDFQKVSAGSHEAVCCAVWDLGRQAQVWNNQEEIIEQVSIVWEVSETIQDKKNEHYGKRLVISRRYTNSMGKKANLRKDLESWRGRAFTKEELGGFDLEKLIGINCLLSVVHNEKDGNVYANVTAVMKAMQGKEKMTPENPLSFCPDWVKKIQANAIPKEPEHQSQEPDIDMSKLNNDEANNSQDPDDEVPF